MTFITFITFVLVFALAVMTPGPANIALVAQALASGFRKTLPMIGGMILGDFLYFVTTIYGLVLVAELMGELFFWLRFFAVIYLIYLAWKFWTQAVIRVEFEAQGHHTPSRLFASGLTVMLGSPRVMTFYLALLPGLLDLQSMDNSDVLVLLATTLCVLTLVLVGYAAMASGLRQWLNAPGPRKIINKIAGGVMFGSAIAIVAK